jgi:hypothetical protein
MLGNFLATCWQIFAFGATFYHISNFKQLSLGNAYFLEISGKYKPGC